MFLRSRGGQFRNASVAGGGMLDVTEHEAVDVRNGSYLIWDFGLVGAKHRVTVFFRRVLAVHAAQASFSHITRDDENTLPKQEY